MTRPIKILIVEDEAPQRQSLVRQLGAAWPEAVVVAQCEDGLSAAEKIQETEPDVVFLDIKIPGLSGIEVAKTIDSQTQIVFTTAYDQYAIEAFETGAIDYLLKPIAEDRLEKAIQRLNDRIASGSTTRVDELVRQLETIKTDSDRYLSWIMASIGDSIKMLSIEEIIFFRAEDKYVTVVTADTKAIIRTPLKKLLTQLNPNQFWQIHRSTVVALRSVDRLKKDELGKWRLSVHGSTELLSVSPAFQKKFRAL